MSATIGFSGSRQAPRDGGSMVTFTFAADDPEQREGQPSSKIKMVIVDLSASVMFAGAQPAKEPYEPGLGQFMTATQLRHAKLWFAGKQNNWDLAAYEIDEIKEGLEDAARLHPTFDGVPVAAMIKTIIDPRMEELEKR
jgi:hypothetical protein